MQNHPLLQLVVQLTDKPAEAASTGGPASPPGSPDITGQPLPLISGLGVRGKAALEKLLTDPHRGQLVTADDDNSISFEDSDLEQSPCGPALVEGAALEGPGAGPCPLAGSSSQHHQSASIRESGSQHSNENETATQPASAEEGPATNEPPLVPGEAQTPEQGDVVPVERHPARAMDITVAPLTLKLSLLPAASCHWPRSVGRCG